MEYSNEKEQGMQVMTMKNVIGELIGYLFLIVFAFGWMDTLWIFGVENSKEYTWWYLIQQLGMYFGWLDNRVWVKNSYNMLIPYYLMFSYLYYEKNISLIDDTEFDQMCKTLLEKYDELDMTYNLVKIPGLI